MRVKRVAILHYAGPPIVGGVEITIYHHARLLIEAGYHVDVVAGRGERFHPEVVFRHVPEIDSRYKQVLEVGDALAKGEVPSMFFRLRERLSERLHPIFAEADVCIVHNAITLHKNLPLTAALRAISTEKVIPLIAWCHDFAWQDILYTPELHPGYPWDLLREPWPGVKYVAVSNHRRARMAELLGVSHDTISVITPGVDVFQFINCHSLTRKLVKDLRLLVADPLMLLPARITRRKNIEFAIRVTAALKCLKPAVTLIVTGPPGPHNPKNIAYLESLQALRAELGVCNQVHLLYEHGETGQALMIPDDVVADLYSLVDLLIFPSYREGFGIPVLEAGLARLPVFAADIPPVNESAGGHAHLFDPNGDAHMVAEAIVEFLEKDQASLLRRRVLRNYTWQSIVDKMLVPLIEEVWGGEENGDE